jgi:hypothetical protein
MESLVESPLVMPSRLLRADTHDPLAVAAQVRADYAAMFPDADRHFVSRAFSWALDCFTGRDPEFLPIDARYHDLEHTLQGTLCLSTLLRGRQESPTEPRLTRNAFELALLAILLHDTGYLKRRDDTTGTGAKYTQTHVARSCDFAQRLLGSKGYTPAEIHSVKNMIRCTGMGANLAAIPFQADWERMCGYALGTADLLGQMAADDYVDKLPILYEEFVESARFNGQSGAPGFTSVDDLMRKTPLFWEKYVLPKVQNDFLGVYRFLAQSATAGRNFYLERIEANIGRLRQRAMMAA